MSLVLNMVGGGSGGGISGNTAVLEVIAPVGSSVSITDGVSTKTQTSADGHPVADRQTVDTPSVMETEEPTGAIACKTVRHKL